MPAELLAQLPTRCCWRGVGGSDDGVAEVPMPEVIVVVLVVAAATAAIVQLRLSLTPRSQSMGQGTRKPEVNCQ